MFVRDIVTSPSGTTAKYISLPLLVGVSDGAKIGHLGPQQCQDGAVVGGITTALPPLLKAPRK